MWLRHLDRTIKVTLIAAAATIIAALIAGFFALLSPITSAIVQSRSSDATVELVDVSVRDSADKATTTLDIKVRNTGEEVALVKEATLGVKKVWELRTGNRGTGGFLPSSHNYDVRLSTSGAPYTKTAKLSQSIEPNEVDRFTITLNLKRGADPNKTHAFLMTLELVSNEDAEITSSRNLLFVPWLPWDMKDYAPETPGEQDFGAADDSRAIRAHNKQVADEISGIDGVKSRRLEQLVRHIREETSK
jgi:hypothetical protein